MVLHYIRFGGQLVKEANLTIDIIITILLVVDLALYAAKVSEGTKRVEPFANKK